MKIKFANAVFNSVTELVQHENSELLTRFLSSNHSAFHCSSLWKTV